MSKALLTLGAAALLLTGCVKDGDDSGLGGCLPNSIQTETCKRTSEHTIHFKFRVGQTLQGGCDPAIAVPLLFNVHAPNNGIVSYKITDDQGHVWDDPYDKHYVDNLTNQLLEGTVTVSGSGVTPELNGFTVNEFGNVEVFDDESIGNCTPRIPPCENQLESDCSYINPNNHCQAATTYVFDLCDATNVTMQFSTNGFGLAKNNVGAYYPITRTITHANGTTTQTTANPTQALTFQLLPGDKLTVSYGSNQPLPVPNSIGSTKLTITNWQAAGLPESTVTLLNDNC